jgi:hypothetical protein
MPDSVHVVKQNRHYLVVFKAKNAIPSAGGFRFAGVLPSEGNRRACGEERLLEEGSHGKADEEEMSCIPIPLFLKYSTIQSRLCTMVFAEMTSPKTSTKGIAVRFMEGLPCQS